MYINIMIKIFLYDNSKYTCSIYKALVNILINKCLSTVDTKTS